MKDYGKPEMATIIFAKKKNLKNDSSIDLDVNHSRRQDATQVDDFASGEVRSS